MLDTGYWKLDAAGYLVNSFKGNTGKKSRADQFWRLDARESVKERKLAEAMQQKIVSGNRNGPMRRQSGQTGAVRKASFKGNCALREWFARIFYIQLKRLIPNAPCF